MSIVKLNGGLGNQLFQFCFGTALQKEIGQKTYFDVSQIRKSARRLEVRRLLEEGDSLLRRNFLTLKKSPNDDIFEGDLIFNQKIVIKKDATYSGKFISPQYWKKYYFEAIQMVEKFLTLNPERKSNSEIALHVRRGDYFYSEKTRKIHGYCTDAYFINALTLAKGINHSLTKVTIFTDSPELVAKLLKEIQERGFRASISSENDPINALAELVQFRNFIGSNSTLSWWAAALFGPKLAIFPKDWFLINDIGFDIEEQLTFNAHILENALTDSSVLL